MERHYSIQENKPAQSIQINGNAQVKGTPTLVRAKLSSITRKFRLPSICILCKHNHKEDTAVCSFCIRLISPIGLACPRCACPLFDHGDLHCGQCIKNPPYFDQAIIAYRFEEPLRSILHHFKYHKGLYLCSFLGELMLNAWHQKKQTSQCLIPVPMHPAKLKGRGFNQAAVLARYLGKKLTIPCDITSCQKVVNTVPQASLNGEKRVRNLYQAFSVKPLPYSKVTLVDDLLTTGSTANELARILKKSGVAEVSIWCCARAINRDE